MTHLYGRDRVRNAAHLGEGVIHERLMTRVETHLGKLFCRPMRHSCSKIPLPVFSEGILPICFPAGHKGLTVVQRDTTTKLR
jgi:hypothetical protein